MRLTSLIEGFVEAKALVEQATLQHHLHLARGEGRNAMRAIRDEREAKIRRGVVDEGRGGHRIVVGCEEGEGEGGKRMTIII